MNKKIDMYLEALQEPQSEIATAFVALSAANMIMAAIRLYKEYFTKAAKQCANLPQNEKSICVLRAKLVAKSKQLQKLKGDMAKCTQAKDAQVCKNKLAEKINALYSEVKFMSERIKALQQQTKQAQ